MVKIRNILKINRLDMVQEKGIEPPLREELDPKSSASTNFATPAQHF
jgi:hypothetical protein